MKFSNFCLGSVFAIAATSAAFVGYKTLETVLDPEHPNYIGYVVLGHMTESHFPEGRKPFVTYDEYLRNRYLEKPQMAYDQLKRVYGVEFNGDHVKAYSDFLKKLTAPITPGNVNEYDTKGALLMFLSKNAFNHEVYTIPDAMGLCNDLIGENSRRIMSGNSARIRECSR